MKTLKQDLLCHSPPTPHLCSLALGHDEPVSIGCPLYNEASAVKGCLVLSSNVIAQRLD